MFIRGTAQFIETTIFFNHLLIDCERVAGGGEYVCELFSLALPSDDIHEKKSMFLGARSKRACVGPLATTWDSLVNIADALSRFPFIHIHNLETPF